MAYKVLTIVVPTYNMEKYLDRCLASLIINDAELFSTLEVLVLNDGSTDRSSEIAHGYQYKYPNVFRVIDKDNGNYGSCINRGLKEATGKFIKVLDADDYFDYKHFQYYLSMLRNIDVDLVLTDYDFVSEKEHVTGTINYSFPVEKELNIEDCISCPDFINLQMHGVTYKRSNLIEIDYSQTEGISYTDQEWVFSPICKINKVFYIKKPLYKYLVGRTGQTIDLSVYHKRVGDRERLVEAMLKAYIKYTGDQKYELYKNYLNIRIKSALESIYMSYLIVNRELDNLELFDKNVFEESLVVYDLLESSTVNKFIPYKYIKKWRENRKLPPLFISKIYLFLKNIQSKLS